MTSTLASRRPAAAEKEEIRRSFLAMALSHELKQPLNSLSLNAEIMAKRLHGIPGAASEVAGPLQAIGRVIDRVTQCLEAYTSVVEPDPVPEERVDLGPIVEAAAQRAQPHARRAQVAVVCDLARSVPRLAVHAAQLDIALDALIENAILASQPGGKVVLALREHGPDEVKLIVSDQGEGMSADVARRSVEIGFSTRGAAGIGMTVAKFIAYHHAGGFQITSQPGEGTSVAITLPARDL